MGPAFKIQAVQSERNVKLASEAKCREVNRSIVDGKTRTTLLSVATETANGTKLANSPMIFVYDLKSFVFDLLDKYKERGELTWHDRGIPEDQIGIKISGGHGKDSIKLCIQIAKSGQAKFNSQKDPQLCKAIKIKISAQRNGIYLRMP